MVLRIIKNLIVSSNLSEEEQKELLVILSQISDKDLKSFLDLFKENKDWIRKIYDNYKIKRKAFVNKDKNLWNEILDQEKRELE